jgi:hypothetical protein
MASIPLGEANRIGSDIYRSGLVVAYMRPINSRMMTMISTTPTRPVGR